MKRIIKNFTVVFAFALLLNTQAIALTYPTFNYNENQTLVVEFNDWKTKALTLEILDSEGGQVYVDQIEAVHESKNEYNLRDLKIGEYYIVLYGSKEKTISSFTKGIEGIQVIENLDSHLFTAKLALNKKKITIDYAAYGEDVRLSILGKRGLQLSAFYEDRINIEESIDISSLERGSYVAVLNSGSQRVSIPFKK